jgi:hypothetical protein
MSERRSIMVAKKKSTGEKEEKKGRIRVARLKLKKETIKDLPGFDSGQVRGGVPVRTGGAYCSYTVGQDEASCAN